MFNTFLNLLRTMFDFFPNIFDWRQEAAPRNWLRSRWPEIRLPCRNQPSFKEMKIEFTEYNNTTLWKRLNLQHLLYLYISLNSFTFHILWKIAVWLIDSLIGWKWLLEAFGSEEKSSSQNIYANQEVCQKVKIIITSFLNVYLKCGESGSIAVVLL